MCQHIGPGGTRVSTRRSLEANQAFQPPEGEFDAPSQAIESENVMGCELRGRERGHQDYPVCSCERVLGELIALPNSSLSTKPQMACAATMWTC